MGDDEIEKLRMQYGIELYRVVEKRQARERKALIRKALVKAYADHPIGPVVFAARLLGIDRHSLVRFMEKYGLERTGLDVN